MSNTHTTVQASFAAAVTLLAGAATITTPALAEDAYEINLCTGGTNGSYYAAGETIKSFAGSGISVTVIETKGSWDNMRLMANGTCNAAIAQPDAYEGYVRENPSLSLLPINTLHEEYAHLICNSRADIDSITDIEGNKGVSIAIGENGSGAWTTWTNWVNEDDDYADNPTLPLGGLAAIAKVATNPNVCALSIVGLGSPGMKEINDLYGDQVTLVDVDDSDFNDTKDRFGDKLYKFTEIDGNDYTQLTPDAMWGRGDVDTVSMRAKVFADATMPPTAQSELIRAVAQARPGIAGPER